jgi:hypothetical protein
MYQSINLLPPLTESLSVVGTPIKGAGWSGQTRGLHTFMVRASNFQGRLGVQATLASLPLAADWFSVLPDAAPYWQYPQQPYIATVNPGETSTLGFNYYGNVLWLRAVVDRDYLLASPLPCQIGGLGLVEILVNF